MQIEAESIKVNKGRFTAHISDLSSVEFTSPSSVTQTYTHYNIFLICYTSIA